MIQFSTNAKLDDDNSIASEHHRPQGMADVSDIPVVFKLLSRTETGPPPSGRQAVTPLSGRVQDNKIVEALKREGGSFDFDDMLTRVRDALVGPGGGPLVSTLRQRYRFALVDEFQIAVELIHILVAFTRFFFQRLVYHLLQLGRYI